jgi:hypothetical protein
VDARAQVGERGGDGVARLSRRARAREHDRGTLEQPSAQEL